MAGPSDHADMEIGGPGMAEVRADGLPVGGRGGLHGEERFFQEISDVFLAESSYETYRFQLTYSIKTPFRLEHFRRFGELKNSVQVIVLYMIL